MFNKTYLILLSSLTILNYAAEIKIVRQNVPGHTWYTRKAGSQVIVAYKDISIDPNTMEKYITYGALVTNANNPTEIKGHAEAVVIYTYIKSEYLTYLKSKLMPA